MVNRISPDPTQPGRFALEQEGQPAVSIRYNEATHSLRLQRESEQRVYLIERDRLSSGRLRLYSEYGLPSGTCHLDDPQARRGTVKLDGHKFRFERHGDSIAISVDGKMTEHVSWQPAGESPEALAGIILLLCREAIAPLRVAT
ncbi:MAG: hypothetical protein EOO16_12700 [Chitinophagaceae bacterium]|nr:MAG: hypothetical protein EOO16_12700 [Chitinophagaceae bacterium]